MLEVVQLCFVELSLVEFRYAGRLREKLLWSGSLAMYTCSMNMPDKAFFGAKVLSVDINSKSLPCDHVGKGFVITNKVVYPENLTGILVFGCESLLNPDYFLHVTIQQNTFRLSRFQLFWP